MNKSKVGIILIVLLVLLNVCTLSFFWLQHNSTERDGAGSATKDFIIKEVGLNDEQIRRFDSLRKIHQSEMIMLNKQSRDLHDQLFENISMVQIDSILINNISNQISKIEVEKQELTLYHFRAFRKLLTPLQQNKFDKIIKKVLRRLGRPGPQKDISRPHKPNEDQPNERNELEPPPGGEDGPPPPPEDRL